MVNSKANLNKKAHPQLRMGFDFALLAD